ncbi:MAG: hypothetical protein QNJ94_02085 [Alphaproteobacteria bacterium]|nr:hypothetical protein [Alphaproteobacteria bacterium]
MKSPHSKILAIALTLGLAACQTGPQWSSGRAYIEKYEQAAGTRTVGMDAEIRKAANVEPSLKFPARIGLARIERGRLTGIPPQEADAWLALAKRLGPAFGDFVPISPLVVGLASADRSPPRPSYRNYEVSRVRQVVQDIRLGAARQHVDVILIYELYSTGADRATVLSVADLTIVGAFLMPSRALEARGIAQAALIDVRDGYHYGSTQAVVTDADFVPNVGSSDRRGELEHDARTAAAVALTDKVEDLAHGLYRRVQQAQSTR